MFSLLLRVSDYLVFTFCLWLGVNFMFPVLPQTQFVFNQLETVGYTFESSCGLPYIAIFKTIKNTTRIRQFENCFTILKTSSQSAPLYSLQRNHVSSSCTTSPLDRARRCNYVSRPLEITELTRVGVEFTESIHLREKKRRTRWSTHQARRQ